MAAQGLRAVLAYLDRDPGSLAGVIEHLATPEGPGFPAAVAAAEDLVQTYEQIAAAQRFVIDTPLGEYGISSLIRQFAPARYRDGAIGLLTSGGRAMLAAHREEVIADSGPPVLLATAARAAKLAGFLFATQHLVAHSLTRLIRDREGTLREIGDDEVRALLRELFPEEEPPPPGQLPAPEADIIALLQRHLADPAPTTGNAELRAWITMIRARATDARPYHTPPRAYPPRR